MYRGFTISKKVFILLASIMSLSVNSLFAMESLPDEEIPSHGISRKFDLERGSQDELNLWVAENSVEIYLLLNNSQLFGYPEPNNNPNYYTQSKDWRLYNPYMGATVDFIKNKAIPPSVAIHSILTSEGRFDCRLAQRIVLMELMRRLMGNDAFDEYGRQFEEEVSQDFSLSQGTTRELHLSGDVALNPFYRLTCGARNSLYRRDYNSGSKATGYFGYIGNINEYAHLHPYGLLRGDHGFLYKKQDVSLYVGYGSFYKNGGLPWNEVVQRFKSETLTLSLPEECSYSKYDLFNERTKRNAEEAHKNNLQNQKNLINCLQNHDDKNWCECFECKFNLRQFEYFDCTASFFVDLEKVKDCVRSVLIRK